VDDDSFHGVGVQELERGSCRLRAGRTVVSWMEVLQAMSVQPLVQSQRCFTVHIDGVSPSHQFRGGGDDSSPIGSQRPAPDACVIIGVAPAAEPAMFQQRMAFHTSIARCRVVGPDTTAADFPDPPGIYRNRPGRLLRDVNFGVTGADIGVAVDMEARSVSLVIGSVRFDRAFVFDGDGFEHLHAYVGMFRIDTFVTVNSGVLPAVTRTIELDPAATRVTLQSTLH
jgi:hypothetical protein